MITVRQNFCNNFSKKKYEFMINSIDLNLIKCSCGHSFCLVRHGYYKRKLKLGFETVLLTILRVKCKTCRKTHAIMPDNIVPYSRIPVDIQRKILIFDTGDKEIQELMEGNTDITEEDIYRIKMKYKMEWKERLASASLDLKINVLELVSSCFFAFEKQFMQVRRGINILF